MTASLARNVAWPQAAGGRITVALIPAVQDDLRRLQERTKMSKTDLANRAITSYAFFESHLNAGDQVMIRDGKTGQTQLVQFL